MSGFPSVAAAAVQNRRDSGLRKMRVWNLTL